MRWPLVVVFVASFIMAIGLLFYKIGVQDLDYWLLLLGFILFVFSSVLVMFALRSEPMSIIFPILSITFVWVSLLSIFVLQESMTGLQWAGVASIMVGISLLGGG